MDLNYPANSFDFVTALEILEDIDDLNKRIEQLKRVSKKWILITVPFEQNIPVVLCPYCLNHFNYDGHLHSFKTSDMVDLLTNHGLAIQKIEYYSIWEPAWKKFLYKALCV